MFSMPVFAVESIVSIAGSFTTSNGADSYAALQSHRRFGWTTEINTNNYSTTAGTFKKLRVVLASAPGASKSYVFTLRKNGADTAITCTISGAAATSCADTTNTVTAAAGDLWDLESSPSGTPTASQSHFTLTFDATIERESLWMASTGSSGGNGTQYFPIMGGDLFTNEEYMKGEIATPGTIKNLYCRLNVAPGAGTSRTFTVRNNNGNTSLTCTVSGASDTTCTDVSNTAAVVAGDEVNFIQTNSGSPSVNTWQCATTFVATEPGMFLVMYSDGNSLTTSSLFSQSHGSGQGDGLTGTEANHDALTDTLYGVALYAEVRVAPGAGTSRTVTVRDDTSNTALACTISGTGKTCNTTNQSVTIAQDSLVAENWTVSGSPTNSDGFRVTILGYTRPRRTYLVN